MKRTTWRLNTYFTCWIQNPDKTAFFLQGNHYWHFDILKTTYWHGSFWIVHFHCRQFEYSTRMLMWFGENQIFRSQVWFTCVYLILHLKLKKFILLLLPYSWVLNTRRRHLSIFRFFFARTLLRTPIYQFLVFLIMMKKM